MTRLTNRARNDLKRVEGPQNRNQTKPNITNQHTKEVFIPFGLNYNFVLSGSDSGVQEMDEMVWERIQ